MKDKKLLRLKAKEIRNNLDIKKISKNIVGNIIKSEFLDKYKNIMIFFPLEKEINLLDLLNRTNRKNFYLPRMNGNNLECCKFSVGDELLIKKYNIKEPVCECSNKNCLDLIILPALSVDKKGNRLGYGGGYYDRFCSDIDCTKAVVIPKILIFDNIPTEKHDIKMDFIISETEIFCL